MTRKKKKPGAESLRAWKGWLAGDGDPPSEPDEATKQARAYFEGKTEAVPSAGLPEALCALAELLSEQARWSGADEPRTRAARALSQLAASGDRRVAKAARTELHRLRAAMGKPLQDALGQKAARRPAVRAPVRPELDAHDDRPALMNAYDSRLFCLVDLVEPDFKPGESVVLTTRLSPLWGVGTAEVLSAPRRSMRRAVRDRLADEELKFTEVGFRFGLSVLRRAMAVHHRSGQPAPAPCTRFLNMVASVPEPSDRHEALRLYPDPPAVDPQQSHEHLEHWSLSNFTPPLDDDGWKRLSESMERGSESGLVLTGRLLEERRVELLGRETEKVLDAEARSAFASALLDTAFLLHRAGDKVVGAWCVGVARLFEDEHVGVGELAFVNKMTLRALAAITVKDESRLAAPGVLDGRTPHLVQAPGAGSGRGTGFGPGLGPGGRSAPPGGLIIPGR